MVEEAHFTPRKISVSKVDSYMIYNEPIADVKYIFLFIYLNT